MRSSLLFPPSRSAVDHDVLTDTAVAAAGGGRVVSLTRLAGDHLWHARVASAAGIADVRLDTALRTAAVVAA